MENNYGRAFVNANIISMLKSNRRFIYSSQSEEDLSERSALSKITKIGIIGARFPTLRAAFSPARKRLLCETV